MRQKHLSAWYQRLKRLGRSGLESFAIAKIMVDNGEILSIVESDFYRRGSCIWGIDYALQYGEPERRNGKMCMIVKTVKLNEFWYNPNNRERRYIQIGGKNA